MIRIVNLNKSSDKYGNCEVCKKTVSEVYMKVVIHGTRRVSDCFGHKACLEASRG